MSGNGDEPPNTHDGLQEENTITVSNLILNYRKKDTIKIIKNSFKRREHIQKKKCAVL